MESKLLTFLFVVFCTTTSLVEAQWTPDPFCPYPSDHVTRYPYYGNCSVYWECYEGTKYVMECPEGLEFNAPLQQCDTPSIANCDPYASTTANPNPPTYTTVSIPSQGPSPTCPYPSDEIIYYPYDGDCSRYWECWQGNAYMYNCPPGLWWHQEISQCDYPGTFCGNTTRPTGGTEGTAGTTPIPATPDALCPYPSEDIIYYPYPGDCSKYLECFEGDRYEMNCPDGLWWHQEISECDFPGEFCSN